MTAQEKKAAEEKAAEEKAAEVIPEEEASLLVCNLVASGKTLAEAKKIAKGDK